MTPLYIALYYSIRYLFLCIFHGINTHTYRLYSGIVHFISVELVYGIQNILFPVLRLETLPKYARLLLKLSAFALLWGMA